MTSTNSSSIKSEMCTLKLRSLRDALDVIQGKGAYRLLSV